MDAKLKTSFVKNLNNKNNIDKINNIRVMPVNLDRYSLFDNLL